MSSEQHFIGKVTQKAFIYLDGKILFNKDVGGTHYDLPGGRLHVGEQPNEGLAREMKEEMGCDVLIGKPFYTCTTKWGREHSPHLFIVYEADLNSPKEQLKPDGVEVGEVRWLSPDELTDHAIHNECLSAIHHFLTHS